VLSAAPETVYILSQLINMSHQVRPSFNITVRGHRYIQPQLSLTEIVEESITQLNSARNGMRKIQLYQRSIFWKIDEVVSLIRKPEVAEMLINQSLYYIGFRSYRCVNLSQETATRFQNVLDLVVKVMEGYNTA
jgi:hypothetical protein